MIKALTSLRFIFALWYFWCISFILLQTYKLIPIFNGSLIMFLKKDLLELFFFTLSRFILAYNYSGKLSLNRVSIRNFWLKRFASLYPLHLLTLYFCIPMMYILYPNNGISEFGKPLVLNLLLLHS